MGESKPGCRSGNFGLLVPACSPTGRNGQKGGRQQAVSHLMHRASRCMRVIRGIPSFGDAFVFPSSGDSRTSCVAPDAASGWSTPGPGGRARLGAAVKGFGWGGARTAGWRRDRGGGWSEVSCTQVKGVVLACSRERGGGFLY